MKFCLPLLACIAVSFYSFSQNIPQNPNITDTKGLRQGKWTLLYDVNWKTVDDQQKAIYYRLIEYRDDKPLGVTRDYFSDGTLQYQGTLLQDRPEEVSDGESNWYRKDGSKELSKKFDKGKLVKETYFNLDGSEAKVNWSSLDKKGVDAYSAGDYYKALDFFEKALIQVRKEFPVEHANHAEALNNLAVLSNIVGQFEKAEQLYIQSRKIREKVSGKEHPDYAGLLNNIAKFYKDKAQYEKALPLYIESKNIREKILGKDDPAYVMSLNNLAALYSDMGQYEKAKQSYLEAKSISERVSGKQHNDYVLILNNLAVLYKNTGEYEKAELLCIEVKNLWKKIHGNRHPYYALSLNNLAGVYSDMQRYDKAEPLYIESKNIREAVLGKGHLDYAMSVGNLATLYCDMGRYEKAEPLYIESKSTREKILGREHPAYAMALSNIATLYTQTGQPDKALVFVTESKSIREKILGKEHPSYAADLNNLAYLYQIKGFYKTSESLYLQSKNINEKLKDKEHPDYARSLNNLAWLYTNMGQYDKAEALYIEAKNIWEKAFGKDHKAYSGSLSNLAFLYMLVGQYDKAKHYFLENNQVNLAIIKRYFPSLSEMEKESFYNTLKNNFEQLNSFSFSYPIDKSGILDEIYNSQLATKALLFNTNNKVRQRIINSENDSLINLYLEWQRQRNTLAKAYQLSSEERKSKKIDIVTLEEDINRKGKELSLQSGAFADLQDNKEYTWRDVQKQLKKNEAAIELIRFRKYGIYKTVTDTSSEAREQYNLRGLTDSVQYVALIITAKSKYPEYVLLTNGNDLEKKYYKNYKNNIQFKLVDEVSYDQFWKPIAVFLEKNKAKKVYLSPDGVYNSINLSTILNPVKEEYVKDQFDIQVITSTKQLITRKAGKGKIKANHAALFGFPDYSGLDTASIDKHKERSFLFDSSQRFFEGGTITNLLGTKIEVKTINELLTSGQVKVNEYLDRQAKEEEVKNLDRPKILHIATHGFFLQDTATYSENYSLAGFEAKTLRQNPLLRSGLFLANAQQAVNGYRNPDVEDGILTAYEAMNLNLDETELVVLSACETGLGEIRNGEGVYGLQRAFQTAGAKSVLMSLWKVDDNATQELMTAFYKNWLKSGDKREAFEQAQLVVRKKYPHPYYWGAFVLVGE